MIDIGIDARSNICCDGSVLRIVETHSTVSHGRYDSGLNPRGIVHIGYCIYLCA